MYGLTPAPGGIGPGPGPGPGSGSSPDFLSVSPRIKLIIATKATEIATLILTHFAFFARYSLASTSEKFFACPSVKGNILLCMGEDKSLCDSDAFNYLAFDIK